eukprot:TRINITY_DN20209_c0_g1_i2.p1 TRINITY_DN20209_c0_g1~~TRINITY_DN20209_c0_g1_i2.p1  ORF type:complete len:1747 (-),score=230.84 TRINITY_DN20209_c0_g1_i2:568-5808(-)
MEADTSETPKLGIADHGLPAAIANSYVEQGISRLYPWQAECLAVEGVASGRNLVYCAPTSGGKTLVSEIIMLRRVAALSKCAIFVLPFVSIVAEKELYLRTLCRRTPLSVKGFYGGSAKGIREPFDVAVCTIEKANSLINRLAEDGTLADGLGTFVVDELHLVGDQSRGYLLEVALSKVLHLAKDAQVIGLSATLPNVDTIGQWLGAAVYRTSYRPVPLSEYVLVDKTLFNMDGSQARELGHEGLPANALEVDRKAGFLVAAVWEAAREGFGVLVFCASKLRCERTAQLLAGSFPSSPESATADKRAALIAEMQRQPCGLDPVLASALPLGVAYHHSGLTTQERALVEQAYRDGVLVAICATSTLAAGVNLPARRVVFQTPYMGNAFLNATQYRQMAGRAGRAGHGQVGESMLIAPPREKQRALELIRQTLPEVRSQLDGARQGLQRLLLEILSVTPLGSGQDLIKFCESTLLATQKSSQGRVLTGDAVRDYPEIAGSMRWLLEHDMVRLDERAQSYSATPLGRAVCACGVEPQQGVFLFRELERARACVSLDTDLHICYLVTPSEAREAVDWSIFSRALRFLSTAERRVAERVGVRLDLVDQAAFTGSLSQKVLATEDGVRLVRFYTSLVLWAVLHETPPPLLLQRFAMGRGQLQQLQQSAASFTTTVAVFCNRLQWYAMEALILTFQQRLTFGVRVELVPLMEIPSMDCVVARALYEHGFTTPVGIAGARPAEILRVLRKTLPHNVPSAALPEAKAEALIEAATGFSRKAAKLKRQELNKARKRLRESQGESEAKSSRLDDRCARQPDARGSNEQGFNPAIPSGEPIPSLDRESKQVYESSARPPVSEQSSSNLAQSSRPFAPLPTDVSSIGITSTREQPPLIRDAPMNAERILGRNLGVPCPGSQLPLQGSSVVIDRRQVQCIASPQRSSIRREPSNSVVDHEQSRPELEFTPYGAAQSVDSNCGSPIENCGTPNQAVDGRGPRETSADVQEALASPAQLSEGLRRIGRQSVTPRDVEAVSGKSPNSDAIPSPAEGSFGQPRRIFFGSAIGEPNQASHAALVRGRSGAATMSMNAFVWSQFSRADDLCLPSLTFLTPEDKQAGAWFESLLVQAKFAGVCITRIGLETDVAFVTLAPSTAFALVLPPAPGPLIGAADSLARWLSCEEHFCVTHAAKQLVGAFLRRSADPRCAFAEPRIAQWLLNPDDKQHVGAAEMAAPLGVRILAFAGNGPILTGANAIKLQHDFRASLLGNWPEAFLTLPLTAVLIRRLNGQLLLDAYTNVEMPLTIVLAWMEHFGMACEPRDPYHTHSHVLYKLAALEEVVRETVGRRVNLHSGEDVGRALFEDLGLPIPIAHKFRRKSNGRIAYRSSADVLKRLQQWQSHPIVDHIIEYRQLAHVVRRMDGLLDGGEAPRTDPLCEHCWEQGKRINSRFGTGALVESDGGAQQQPPLKRVRTDFVQTGTATGRLATAAGSLPLLCLENPFLIREVWRPSLHDELASGRVVEVGARVFTTVATEAPPRPRRLCGGQIHSLEQASCAELLPGSTETVAEYWVARGWDEYASRERASSVLQVLVARGPDTVLSYPADQVWRLKAPVRVVNSTPMVTVNPRRLLVAEHGRLLLSVDYSQLEVRLMAHFSKDIGFLRILRGGGDLFRHVAAGWLQKAEVDITAEERSGAKQICYGLVYGIGASRLALDLGISRAQAQEFQTSFMREYTGLSAWISTCRENARVKGFVETIHGQSW